MTLNDLFSSQFNKDMTRGFNQGISKIYLLGDFSRSFRYPQEFARQLGGISKYGLGALSGMDNEKLQQIMKEYQEPMYMNQGEWNKMTGKTSVASPIIEGGAAGADLMSWVLPMGIVDDAIKAAAASKTSSKIIPWLLGKAGSGTAMGVPRGISMADASKPEEILSNIGKSSAISAGLNVGVGALQEGAKAIGRLGTQTSARAQGIPGQTSAEKASNLKLAKEEGVSGLTAQSRIDKAKPKVAELGTEKQDVLSKMGNDIKNVKTEASNKIKEMIDSSGRAEEIRGSIGYKNLVSAFKKANTAADLDNLVVKYENLSKYGGQGIDSATQEVYKNSARAMVEALKNTANYSDKTLGAAQRYTAIKDSLNNVYQTSLQPEVLKKAAKESQGITLPLIAGGAEMMAAPKGAFSLLGSAAGGLEKAIGKIGGSGAFGKSALFGIGEGLTKGLGGMQTAEPEMDGTQNQEESIVDLTDVFANIGNIDSSEQFSGPMAMGSGLGLSQEELGFGMGQQAQPQSSGIDMEKLYTRLMQGVARGNITSSDAEFIVGIARKLGGSQDSLGSKIEQAAQTDPQLATQLLGQGVLSGEIDATTANTIARLYGLNAVPRSALAGLDSAESVVSDAEKMIEELNLFGGGMGITGEILAAPIGVARQAYGTLVPGSLEGEYKTLLEGYRVKLARALGEVGNLSEPEQEAAMKNLPSLTDTPERAARKLARIKGILSDSRIRLEGGSANIDSEL